MGNKQEILRELEELKRKVEGLEDDDEELWYLSLIHSNISSLIAEAKAPIFKTISSFTTLGNKPHGLGVYKSKEYAEMARACLIDLLSTLKEADKNQQMGAYYSGVTVNVNRGKEIIKKMKEGKYA